MAQIQKMLQEWQSNGLISDSQQQNILAFENAKPKTRWGQLGFVLLGCGTVILGIISIIASNWQMIPDAVKLVTSFVLMLTLAGSIYKFRDHKSVTLTDGLRALYALYCFGMIGLIAQIYHLEGDGYKTGLLWCALTVLIISQSKNYLVPMLWCFIFGTCFLIGLNNHPWADLYVTNPLAFFILTVTLAVFGLKSIDRDSTLQSSFTWCTFLAWMIGLCLSSVSFRGETFMGTKFASYNFSNYLIEYVLSIIVAACLMLNAEFKKSEKIALLASLVVANILLSFNFMAKEHYIFLILGALLCLSAWAFFFISRQMFRHFNFVIILMGYKVFEFFIRKFKTLLATGFGLILMGVLVLAVIWAWSKNRTKIEARLQELIG
jgi:Predicted membrane protein